MRVDQEVSLGVGTGTESEIKEQCSTSNMHFGFSVFSQEVNVIMPMIFTHSHNKTIYSVVLPWFTVTLNLRIKILLETFLISMASCLETTLTRRRGCDSAGKKKF